ncbi:MAG: MBL fold metallo-hydrolase [Rhodospirillaceae bacterium]|jgi:glyoxylase-like metal-dependent hydrolase (beta-lactamase superfamily II)|nr:MBL fold metallo-hydrolase [Rhodospirillaceae bacterium]MBT5945980.1 MBL fold metallo-hydrolase [Rhodospirillaceae bacterium]MBT6405644.1 MBL fold metallo-hydrolase [Rhodospirillaceae bacterium]MBT6534881.1 MBL fold metallo-hydrolase [Rhodospirillaceae bacterium]MBT7361753.1 MBL fold metallo-hydrolase [Rhodospirillaceae bacterium]
MQPLTIGAFTVKSVHEDTGAYITPADMFPTATADAVAAHLDWMAPTYFDIASGKLKLAFQSFILQTPQHNILIDTCVGEDKERTHPDFHMKKWPWMDNLLALGLTPADIDIVMCTHLHPDHVGWNTQLRDGRWVPTFPNAKYVFARDEYAHWEKESAQGSERIGLTFIDSVLPVMEAGQAVLVDHDHQIEDGIWLEPTPGHSPGHVIVNVESNGERGAFIGDLMHHPIQVPHPEWSTCFCWDMEMSAASRTAFVDTHTDAGTLVLPVHFAGATAGHITRYGNAQKFTFLDDPS